MHARKSLRPSMSPLRFALLGGLTLSLGACGGGGGSSPSASTGGVSGVVLDGPIQGATVCLDLNANRKCDSGEPTSAPTDEHGRYSITGLTDEQLASGKEWIASVPAGASDGGAPFSAPFVLRTAGDKPGVISPFTHMVQVAIDQGATTPAAARNAVAAQLGVSADALYGQYLGGNPSADNALLAQHAPGVVALLLAGTQPEVALNPAQLPATGRFTVRRLAYTDAGNYVIRVFHSAAVNGQSAFYDVRSGLSGGNPLSLDALYGTSRYLTAAGWATLGPDVPNPNSAGNPSTSIFAGSVNINLRQITPLDGRTAAEAVALSNDTTRNTAPTLISRPGTLSGLLPPGALAVPVRSTSVRTAIYYNTGPGNILAEGYNNPALTTLDAVIAAFPVTTNLTGGNTLSMGNLQPNTSYACPTGQASCVLPQQRLRAQIDSGNAVRWILCDLNWPAGTTAGGCQAIGSGSYARSTGIDGQTPLLSFSGLPAQATDMGFVRVFAQTGGQVWFALRDKPSTTVTTRLNDVAFAPIASQLGISVPGLPN